MHHIVFVVVVGRKLKQHNNYLNPGDDLFTAQSRRLYTDENIQK